jgi:hypothetical protein
MPREVVIRPEPTEPGQETRDGLSIGWSNGGQWLQVYIQPFGSKDTSEWSIALLDRDDANRLIRAARKARDAAFGKDA